MPDDKMQVSLQDLIDKMAKLQDDMEAIGKILTLMKDKVGNVTVDLPRWDNCGGTGPYN